ncbi:MAG: Crp/Fnr family transcriptional regulator [Peptococcales bacterium]
MFSSSSEREMLALTSPWISPSNLDWNQITPYGNVRKYKKNDVIVHMGEKVKQLFFLNKGQVKMTALTKSGTEKTIWYINAPNIFGEVPFFHNLPCKYMIVASKNAEIYCFERDFVENKLVHYPTIVKYLFRLCTQKVAVLSSQIEDLAFYTPLARVAKVIYLLLAQHGEQLDNDKYLINVRLTHQELANITGLHRVTATNALGKLCENDIIEKSRDAIIIKNLIALEEIIDKGE